MPLLDCDGVKIYEEDHGHGSLILLSYGYTASCRNEQITALAARHRVIIRDMHGYGESDDPTDLAAYSEALTVEDTRGLPRRCRIDRAVIGVSRVAALCRL